MNQNIPGEILVSQSAQKLPWSRPKISALDLNGTEGGTVPGVNETTTPPGTVS